MLIQALCDYYEILEHKGEVLPEEYSTVNISYLISLTSEGIIDGIIDWRETEQIEQNGKIKEKKHPRKICLPKRTEKTGIDGNIVEHRPLYIFGLNYDSSTGLFTPDDKTDKARKSHEAFMKTNAAFFDGLDEPICLAFSAFLKTWLPGQEINNSYLHQIGKELSTSGFAFCLSGHPEILLHESLAVRKKWEAICQTMQNEAETTAQCAVYGEELPIARIHDKIRSVPGGLATGNTLISFKNDAESSYGMEQSFNSNISEKAMKHYTQALNYLISNREHRTVIDDLVIIYWAASNNDAYNELFNFLMFSEEIDAEHANKDLKLAMQGIAKGQMLTDTEYFKNNLKQDVSFYIVGIKPNSARLSVKFMYRENFGKLINNVLMHQQDLRIEDYTGQIPLWRIRKELVSPKSDKEKMDPAITAKILEAAVKGYPYPSELLHTMIRRIRTDRDEENNSFIQMNNVRMGVLKACINRACRIYGQKEDIKMALDKSNTNPAYLCGRLFAVLENIQQRASGYNLNRTIKDAYFSAASTRPAIVFPKLLALSQHHMNKFDNSKFMDEEIQAITGQLGTEFPDVLPLKEQGIFMLGYYQQKNDITRKIKEYKANQEVEE